MDGNNNYALKILFFSKNLSLHSISFHSTHPPPFSTRRVAYAPPIHVNSLVRTLIKQHRRLPPTYTVPRRRLYLICSICVQITTFETINPFLMHLTMNIFTLSQPLRRKVPASFMSTTLSLSTTLVFSTDTVIISVFLKSDGILYNIYKIQFRYLKIIFLTPYWNFI